MLVSLSLNNTGIKNKANNIRAIKPPREIPEILKNFFIAVSFLNKNCAKIQQFIFPPKSRGVEMSGEWRVFVPQPKSRRP
jgi:hypothetical protein